MQRRFNTLAQSGRPGPEAPGPAHDGTTDCGFVLVFAPEFGYAMQLASTHVILCRFLQRCRKEQHVCEPAA